ncbi:hypothetical protein OnM2_073005 [Erysiphe neolycopersici]|uniref:Reverse transcriptase domain-containing protein n=1 Tax=Erysiphe neolycopersici TaxID=212602 RepID=A0A420HJ71_9PEZI|nr:hypothetical protein OnM2_073005 [Erysiphe neolycopersici]
MTTLHSKIVFLGSQRKVFVKFGSNLKGSDKSLYTQSLSAASLYGLACSACGSDYRVEMHHVRILKDLNPKLSKIDQLMVRRRRKQIAFIESIYAFIFYLLQYSISNLNVFIILISIGYSFYSYVNNSDNYKQLKDKNNSPIQLISQLKGYFNINPLLSLSLAITIFSFVGIPPLIGSGTAGVDGITINTKSDDVDNQIDNPKTYKAKPVRRVYIPKSNGKLRPLGIPTIKDRTLQSLINSILLPLVELTSDKQSYGYRPYRSAKNAVGTIRQCLMTGSEYK